MSDVSGANFADRLIQKTRELGPLCVGLDPHLERIPRLFGAPASGLEARAATVGSFLEAMLEQLEGRVAAIKPQSAFFEQLGWRGFRLMGDIMRAARGANIEVILDAKRGDIGSTAGAYARAFLSPGAELEADALTVNAYLGCSSLEPFVERAEAHGKGLFVLVKTSNPGSSEFQNRELEGAPLYARVAESLAPLQRRLLGSQTGWSSLGCVVGATNPDEAPRVRGLLPHALFLVPGYGAQGGSARAAVAAFSRTPMGLEGGVVNASRSVLFPAAAEQATDAKAWSRAVTQAIEHAQADLARACV